MSGAGCEHPAAAAHHEHHEHHEVNTAHHWPMVRTYTTAHPTRPWADTAERAAWLWEDTPDDPHALLAQWLRRWKADPVLFAFECLRVALTPYQAQILLDLADVPAEVYAWYGLDAGFPKRQVLVPSGHGLGKTRLCAVAIWWHQLCHRSSKRLATAPTSDQLTGQMLGEIHKLLRRMRRQWPQLADAWEVQTASIVHKDPSYRDWITQFRTARADRPEALQGGHALDEDDLFGDLARLWGDADMESPAGGMLVIFEEASGIHDQIRQTLQGTLSEAGARLLAPGNPTRADGWFAADIEKPDQYAVHPLDCRMSDRRAVYALPYRAPDGSVHSIRLRGFVEPGYWDGIRKDCDGDEDADYFRVRVRGLPPRSNVLQVIAKPWVEAAMERAPTAGCLRSERVLGLDFGQMTDKHAVAVRSGKAVLAVEEWLSPATPEEQQMSAAYRALEWQEQYDAGVIVGDSNGVGQGVMSLLTEFYAGRIELNGRRWRGRPVRVVHFYAGDRALDARRYYRRRDELWYRLGRRWLADPAASLPPGVPGLLEQLTAPGFEEDATKRIKVETKKEIKKRTGQASGNAADAVLMTLVPMVPDDRSSAVVANDATTEAPLHPAIKQILDRNRAMAGEPDDFGYA